MHHAILIFPLLTPLATAVLCLAAWNQRVAQRWISTIGGILLLISSGALMQLIWNDGIQVSQMGNWPAPFGISIVGDLFSAIMVLVTGIIGLAVIVYSLAVIDPPRESFGYHPLIHLMLMGVCGAFLTGDMFNLYVWFEVMLIASFVLMALGGETAQLEGATKYVTLSLLASLLFLIAAGLIYALVGTLNMADIARRLADSDHPVLVGGVAMLLLVAFGLKAAVFPLFFWLPASYHTPPSPVSALLAGLLTKVGVYALVRMCTLVEGFEGSQLQTLLIWCAALTMITGVLGAAVQDEFRRILSFHIVSQIGYMIMGLAIFSPLALAGTIFYLFHHIIVKANLFLVSGITHRLGGSYELKKLGGFAVSAPVVAIVFFIPAMSLAGIPPLSGFWAKFVLIRSGLVEERFWLVGTALVVSILTVYSMTKIWAQVFWKPLPETPTAETQLKSVSDPREPWVRLMGPSIVLAGITLVIGVWAEPFLAVSTRAAEQLLNPGEYIETVLGER